jgi:hypothetical protein
VHLIFQNHVGRQNDSITVVQMGQIPSLPLVHCLPDPRSSVS